MAHAAGHVATINLMMRIATWDNVWEGAMEPWAKPQHGGVGARGWKSLPQLWLWGLDLRCVASNLYQRRQPW